MMATTKLGDPKWIECERIVKLFGNAFVEGLTITLGGTSSVKQQTCDYQQLLIRSCPRLKAIEYEGNGDYELVTVVIDDTGLVSIPARVFGGGIGSLTTLRVTCNPSLKSTPALESHNWVHLEELDLSRNALQTLPRHVFAHTGKLKRVCLSGNNLVEIPLGLGMNSRFLVLLDVSCNPGLGQLPLDIPELILLQQLILDGCTQVRSLPPRMEDCVSLRVISALNAGLQHVPIAALGALPNLTNLRLMGCPLHMHRGELIGSDNVHDQHTSKAIIRTGCGSGCGSGSGIRTTEESNDWIDPIQGSLQAQSFADAMRADPDSIPPESQLQRAGQMGYVLGEASLQGGAYTAAESHRQDLGPGPDLAADAAGEKKQQDPGGSITQLAYPGHLAPADSNGGDTGGDGGKLKHGVGGGEGASGGRAGAEGLALGLLRAAGHPGGAAAALWRADSVRRAGAGLDHLPGGTESRRAAAAGAPQAARGTGKTTDAEPDVDVLQDGRPRRHLGREHGSDSSDPVQYFQSQIGMDSKNTRAFSSTSSTPSWAASRLEG